MYKLLEILGSSKLLLTETETSKEYDITGIEKYTEIRRITIYIKKEFDHFPPSYSYYYHGALIIPLKEPIEVSGVIRIPILGKIDDLFIMVLNNLVRSWLLREQRNFIPEFEKVLKENKIKYTINDSGIFYFKNGFEFSSLTRIFDNGMVRRIPTTMSPEKVLKHMIEFTKKDIIFKWKIDKRKGLKKYATLLGKY